LQDLPKGDYVLRLHFRHESPAHLEKLTNLNILLERPLAKVPKPNTCTHTHKKMKRQKKNKRRRRRRLFNK
jgi:hypothetical protein